jgi:hypothetical protein
MPSPPSATGRTTCAITSRWRRPASRLRRSQVSGSGRPVTAATTSAVNSSPSTLATSSASTHAADRLPMRVAMAASTRAGSSSQRSPGPSTQRPRWSRRRSPRTCMPAQELDREQRVSAGVRRQSGAKRRPERVGFAVEHGVHEGRVGGVGQVDELGLTRGQQLADRGGQRARPRAVVWRDVLRAVGAHEQHPRRAEPAGEVEEELHGARVDPLQVVQQDEHALAARQVAQDTAVNCSNSAVGTAARCGGGRGARWASASRRARRSSATPACGARSVAAWAS